MSMLSLETTHRGLWVATVDVEKEEFGSYLRLVCVLCLCCVEGRRGMDVIMSSTPGPFVVYTLRV
jgi:hypothetical protein